MPAELIERGALHRENPPIRIVGRVGAAENVECLLRIAVVGERAAPRGEQHLIAGMSDGRLLEHGGRLGALPVGTQRLAVSQSGVGILGIGTVAVAHHFGRGVRIGIGRCLGLRRERSGDVGHGLAAAEAGGQNRRHSHGCKVPGKTGLKTHGT